MQIKPAPNTTTTTTTSNSNKKLTTTIDGPFLRISEVGNPSNQCSITFHRTLRIPDDGKTYPLPPSLGNFPLSKVDDYLDKVPEEWRKTGGIFFPMHQREAMWMQFSAESSRPKALKIAVGKVNAINGQTWSNKLEQGDYVTIPKQPWLDGINAGGKGTIKQFVAMPLGSGYSVEAQVTGEEKFGGIQLMVFDSKEDKRRRRFPETTPKPIVHKSPQVKFPLKPTPVPPPMHNPPFVPFSAAPPAPMMPYCSSYSSTGSIQQDDLFAPPPPSYAAPVLANASASSASSSSSFSFAPSTNHAPMMKKSVAPSAKGMAFGAPRSRSLNQPQQQQQQQPYPELRQSSAVPKQEAKEMSLSAGGSMKQEISKDEFGIDFWDQECFARVYVRIVNSEMYEQITGKKAPETPITAQTYSSYGYPWFDIYNESPQNSIDQSNILNQVKSVKQIDSEKYAWPQQDDSSIQLTGAQVKKLYSNPNEVRDGDW